MSVFLKTVKRHTEIWADIPEGGEGRVRFSNGYLFPGYPYVSFGAGERVVRLSDSDTKKAFLLAKKLWKKNEKRVESEGAFGYE